MKKFSWVVVLVAIVATLSVSQKDVMSANGSAGGRRGTGALPREGKPQYTALDDKWNRSGELPDAVDLSETQYFPPIGDQGAVGSCVAWATTYYQFTYQVAQMKEWDAKIKRYQFSPKWTYNYINKGVDGGAQEVDAYAILRHHGAASWNEFPYDENYREWSHDTDVMRRALTYRVSEVTYESFAPDDEKTPITSNKSPCLDRMKQLLNDGKPLVVSSDVGNAQGNTFGDWTFKTSEAGEVAVRQWNWTPLREGHAVTIVGYDDDLSYDLNEDGFIQEFEQGAFKVANSWGTRFKNDGFVWVMYDALNAESNASRLNGYSRNPIFEHYAYYTIEVEEYEPQMTAEVTLHQKNRSKVRISLAEHDGQVVNENRYVTMLNYAGGDHTIGSTASSNTATFYFDFGPLLDADWRTRDWCVVVDDNGTDTTQTRVSSVKIVRDGTEVLSRASNESFSSATRIISTSASNTISTTQVAATKNSAIRSATEIVMGACVPVNVTEEEEGRFYAFTPTYSSEYVIASYSTGRVNPVVYVHEGVYGETGGDDDGSGGRDFRLQQPMVAGQTYYIEASSYWPDSSYTFTVLPVTGVDVTGTFLDANFLAAVREALGIRQRPIFDYDVSGVASLDVRGRGIADLSGIGWFGSLSSLDCGDNQLTALDVSHNTKLTFLSCVNNNIPSIGAIIGWQLAPGLVAGGTFLYDAEVVPPGNLPIAAGPSGNQGSVDSSGKKPVRNVGSKRLSRPKGLKLTTKRAVWKGVKGNSGYTLKLYQVGRKKPIKTASIGKGKTAYKIPKRLFQKGRKYRFTLVAKGKGEYKNSKQAKGGVLKVKAT